MQVQWPWSFPKCELFMSKNARQGRFLNLLLQVVANWSRRTRMGCLWSVEPVNRRKTQGDLLPISYKYNDSKTGIPTFTVTLLPWTTQLSGKICWPALLFNSMGEKSIWQKTTGQENSKVSVCLKAKADGTKLKLFINYYCLSGSQERNEGVEWGV